MDSLQRKKLTKYKPKLKRTKLKPISHNKSSTSANETKRLRKNHKNLQRFGLVASPNTSAYIASNHGVIGLTKAVALEAAGSGVTCNAICPGYVLTQIIQKPINLFKEKEGISFE